MNQKLLETSEFFSNVPAMAMSFLLPLYSMELGFTAFETTGLFAVVSFSLLLSRIMAGTICDKIGRKNVFCFGLFLNAFAYAALAFSQNAVSLYLSQALKGGAISLVSVSMHAIMSDNRNESFAVRQSKISNARGRGELTGVLICWALLNTITFKDSWKYLLLIGAGLACYSAFLSQKRMIETKKCSASSPSTPIPEKLTNLFFVQILLSFASSLVEVILILYLVMAFSLQTSEMALILLAPAAILVFILPTLGKAIEELGEWICFKAGCIGSAFVLCAMPLQKSAIWFAVIWTLYNIFASLSSLAFNSILSLNSEEDIRGKISGRLMASSSLGNFIGAVISGIAFQCLGFAVPFYLSAMFFTASLFKIQAIRKSGGVFFGWPEGFKRRQL